MGKDIFVDFWIQGITLTSSLFFRKINGTLVQSGYIPAKTAGPRELQSSLCANFLNIFIPRTMS